MRDAVSRGLQRGVMALRAMSAAMWFAATIGVAASAATPRMTDASLPAAFIHRGSSASIIALYAPAEWPDSAMRSGSPP